jgi:hypothetical protein
LPDPLEQLSLECKELETKLHFIGAVFRSAALLHWEFLSVLLREWHVGMLGFPTEWYSCNERSVFDPKQRCFQ